VPLHNFVCDSSGKEMNAETLRRMAADPATFRRYLLIDVEGTPRRLGEVVDPWQDDDFRALDAGWRRVAGQAVEGGFQRGYLERPRGHAKTADIGIMVTWALLASPVKIKGYAAAGDLDQAGLLRDAIDGLARLNPWLAELLEIQSAKVKNRRTGAELITLTSDSPTSYGLQPDFVVCDELTNWGKRDLWDSLLSASAKRARCLLLVIANAGFHDSWQWETRETIRLDPAWYFHRIERPEASWITPDRLEEQRRHLPDIAYQRLWLNRWVSGAGGDAFDRADIAACCTLAGALDAAETGYNYVCALDLATRKDSSAAVILGRHCGHRERIVRGRARPMTMIEEIRFDLGHGQRPEPETSTRIVPGSGRLKLARCKAWKPTGNRRVSLDAVKAWVLEKHEAFRFRCVALDPSQGELLAEQLRQAGLHIDLRDQTATTLTEQAVGLLDALQERRIDMYADPDLLADLQRARALEKSYGWRLWWPRKTGEGPGTGHGDLGTALSIGVAVSKRYKTRPGPPRVDRPLVCA